MGKILYIWVRYYIYGYDILYMGKIYIFIFFLVFTCMCGGKTRKMVHLLEGKEKGIIVYFVRERGQEIHIIVLLYFIMVALLWELYYFIIFIF